MNRFSQRGFRLVGKRLVAFSAIALLSLDLPVNGRSPQPLPSPEEAARQAEELSPQELTNVVIDEEMRDRLRFDPAWQPIVRSVRQDLMILKWGDNQLGNPAWERYGRNAYPLFDYYSRSADPTRQLYGVVGIRRLGQPYTTLWLERQLQRQTSGPDFYLITGNPTILLDPNADASYEYDWQKDFGLDDPETRDRLVQLAQQNLKPETDPDYYNQFNLSFLSAVLGYEAVFPHQPYDDSQPAPSIPEWTRFVALTAPTDAQLQEAIAYYRSLSEETQEYILVKQLGAVNAGELSPVEEAVLRALATDPDSPNRVWAIAELDRHNDPQGSAMLQAILNGDLTPLHALARYASYGNSIFPREGDRATHAYYLLVGMAEKYPQSKFIQAAREYGELTGHYYFGGEPHSDGSIERANARPAAERAAAWQNWLNRYPDHPGADDATYFLARSLQDQNQVIAALDLWIQMMTQPQGDGDAQYLAWPHVRTLLDIGLSTEQLQELVERYEDEQRTAAPQAAIAPLLRYALAVHQAREHNYRAALDTSAELDLTTMPGDILGSYYDSEIWFIPWLSNRYDPAQLQRDMQSMLTEQRQRWQRLQQLQAETTAQARYQLASDWAGEGGWKNGYLPVWNESRIYLLPTGNWGDYYCQVFWVCNTALRGQEEVQSAYQQASQNAIALSLYQSLLDDPAIPDAIREKALFMATATLLSQWEDYPLGETFRIHPPAGVTAQTTAPSPGVDDSYEQWQTTYDAVEQSYLNTLDQAIAELKQDFPQSAYIDDLLFSRYAMSGQVRYLQEIVEQYGTGDRAAEAQFLLEHRL